jgi:membrane-associated protein
MERLAAFFHQLMDVESQRALIIQGGYALLAAIVFAETGLLVGFFLPGDSLLFSAGVVAGLPGSGLDVRVLLVLLTATAIVGDAVGYGIGRWSGPRLFQREKSLLFRKDALVSTQAYYERHGGKTIILARFMPLIRTFAPVVAGVAQMPYRRFLVYNVVGAAAWVMSMTLLGYLLGQQLRAKSMERAVIGIVALSFAPLVLPAIRRRLGRLTR